MSNRPLIALAALAAVCGVGSSRAQQTASPKPAAATTAEFEAMLAQYDAAQVEFHNGRPDGVLALWSHSDDVTLTGGAGGAIEKGWQNVGTRLRWASAQYSRGTQVNKRIQSAVYGDLAYAVQTEHMTFYPPGSARQSNRDYRVTSVFRREPAGWRVIHRQADTMMMRETPR